MIHILISVDDAAQFGRSPRRFANLRQSMSSTGLKQTPIISSKPVKQCTSSDSDTGKSEKNNK